MKNNLHIYDQLRKDLPESLSKDDFFHLKLKPNPDLLGKPFRHKEIPLAIEGTDLTGVGFSPINKASASVLEDFNFDLKIPLPQLFCYRNPHQVYVLSIADETEVLKPIHLTLKQAPDNIAFTLLIHIGKNSKASIVERFEGTANRMILYNHQIQAKQDSNLRMISVQNLSPGTQIFEFRETQSAKSAKVHWLNFQLGSKNVYGNMTHYGNGEHADLNTDLLCRTQDDQDLQFEIKNVYRSPNGRGTMTAKGAALDKSRLSMHGCIKIEQTGGGTDAHLTQDSLLLSREAKIKATPSLEIDTNDVKAAHGASVSNLSEEDLFYLSTRGIEAEEARKMMTQGFLTEQLSKIDDLPEVKEHILNLI